MGYTPSTRLTTTLCGIPLPSPIFLASGTAGTLDETSDVLDTSILGGIVTKSITRHPRQGNPYPRITWTRAGMLNAIGLANPGLDAWKSDIAPNIKPSPTTFVGSVAGDSIDDYVQIASAMDAVDAMKIIELNVSCPNVHSGLEFGADPAALKDLVTHARAATPSTKLFVKLSPITVGTPHTIVDLAKVAIDAGADGLTLCNTVPAMGIDVHTRKPILANITGGMSGPSIHPITVRLVHLVYSQLAKHTNTPIMAAGGVTRWEDAAEFILAGATTVQIGAGSLADLNTPRRVIKGLDKWCVKQNASSIRDLVGQVKL
tara:strand:+ start:307 stop:1257 length:951 start_codon:yes stop_codon:yes gene_type:complete